MNRARIRVISAQIARKKNQRISFFFKFAIDPICELRYTFQTYLCKVGGSLRVRLNFSGGIVKLLKKFARKFFFNFRFSRLKNEMRRCQWRKEIAS